MKHRTSSLTAIGVSGLAAIAFPALALAHVSAEPHTHASGFGAGFIHPWLGLDHLLAMVVVGMLATRAGSPRALWLVPCGFIAGMAVGAVASYATLPVPGVEWFIAASVILLGGALALLPRVRTLPSALLVAIAGVFHGHAHITEMSGSVLSYASGMLLATALLHTAGIAAGLVLLRLRAEPATRIAGGVIACGFAISLMVY